MKESLAGGLVTDVDVSVLLQQLRHQSRLVQLHSLIYFSILSTSLCNYSSSPLPSVLKIITASLDENTLETDQHMIKELYAIKTLNTTSFLIYEIMKYKP